MEFELKISEERVAKNVEHFLRMHGHMCGLSGISLFWEKWEKKCIKVAFKTNILKVSAPEEVHFYRGVHLALIEISLGKYSYFEKEEKILFAETGLMLDCSRNGTADIPFIKEIIRFLAATGIGQLYLYMEDVYEIPEDPYFGAFRGRYTFEDLQQINNYGLQYRVEVIPAIQTLAHLHTYLRWPKAAFLRDTDDILLAGTKETESFVRRMIENVCRPFTTKKIHIGMDEATLLGLGQYLRNNGYEERYGIMVRHLEMVCGLCREYGLEPMMWSDMFFRLKSSDGDYYNLPEDTQFDMIEHLPEDLSLVYWDYYHHNDGIYEKNIRLHYKLTDRLRFAGGGWTWNGIAPNYSKAKETLSAGMNASRKQGIDKVFCTFWFDNGTETPICTSFYSAAYFAQLCYNETVEEDEVDRWIKMLTDFTAQEYRLLDAFDSTIGTKNGNQNADNPSKYIFYQDPLIGLFDGQIEGLGLDIYYRDLADKLKLVLAGKKENAMYECFAYYQLLAEILSEKAVLGHEIRAAWKRKDKEKMRCLCVRLLECAERTDCLRERRKKIWFNECRPFGYEVLDIRFGGVAVRLRSTVDRLKLWISSEIDYLAELEEPRIRYFIDEEDPSHRMCMANCWQDLVSAGNIAGI